jgi:hypothetical protein
MISSNVVICKNMDYIVINAGGGKSIYQLSRQLMEWINSGNAKLFSSGALSVLSVLHNFRAVPTSTLE